MKIRPVLSEYFPLLESVNRLRGILQAYAAAMYMLFNKMLQA